MLHFDSTSHHVPAASLVSERGIEFLAVNIQKMGPEDQAEADLILKYLSSLLSLPPVLASRQPDGEWLLFGEAQFVSACRTADLDHVKWVEHSLIIRRVES